MALAAIFRSSSPRTLRIHVAQPARALNAEMDQLFHRLWSRFEYPRPIQDTPAFLPRVDLIETDHELRVSAELPGLKSDDFHVDFEDGVLTLRGEKRRGNAPESCDRHRAERSYGRFERRVLIPVEVEADEARAVYRDGVLVITLPKSEAAKVLEIPIDAA